VRIAELSRLSGVPVPTHQVNWRRARSPRSMRTGTAIERLRRRLSAPSCSRQRWLPYGGSPRRTTPLSGSA